MRGAGRSPLSIRVRPLRTSPAGRTMTSIEPIAYSHFSNLNSLCHAS